MIISPRIRGLLGQQELEILEEYGELLSGLADRTVAAKTERQHQFVEAINSISNNNTGLSVQAWKKYQALALLISQLDEANVLVNKLIKEREEFEDNINIHAKEIKLLRRLIRKPKSALLDKEILDKLPEADVSRLLRYEYLISLNNDGALDKDLFDDFKAISHLWKSLHNYEKVERGQIPLPHSNNNSSLAHEEHCKACDKPISLCICSR